MRFIYIYTLHSDFVKFNEQPTGCVIISALQSQDMPGPDQPSMQAGEPSAWIHRLLFQRPGQTGLWPSGHGWRLEEEALDVRKWGLEMVGGCTWEAAEQWSLHLTLQYTACNTKEHVQQLHHFHLKHVWRFPDATGFCCSSTSRNSLPKSLKPEARSSSMFRHVPATCAPCLQLHAHTGTPHQVTKVSIPGCVATLREKINTNLFKRKTWIYLWVVPYLCAFLSESNIKTQAMFM